MRPFFFNRLTKRKAAFPPFVIRYSLFVTKKKKRETYKYRIFKFVTYKL